MQNELDQASSNFIYRIVEKILYKMFEEIISEAKKEVDERCEYIDAKQLEHKYCMSASEVKINFTQNKKMLLIEKRKPGTLRGKRYWPADEAIKICNEIMDSWD